MTKLRRTFSRTFSVRHSSVTLRLSNLGSGGRVRSPRVRGGVDLGGRGRGSEGGCFSENDTEFPGLASDPTRPDPTSTSEPNFHILSLDPTPSDLTPYWRVKTRRVERFSYRIILEGHKYYGYKAKNLHHSPWDDDKDGDGIQ